MYFKGKGDLVVGIKINSLAEEADFIEVLYTAPAYSKERDPDYADFLFGSMIQKGCTHYCRTSGGELNNEEAKALPLGHPDKYWWEYDTEYGRTLHTKLVGSCFHEGFIRDPANFEPKLPYFLYRLAPKWVGSFASLVWSMPQFERKLTDIKYDDTCVHGVQVRTEWEVKADGKEWATFGQDYIIGKTEWRLR